MNDKDTNSQGSINPFSYFTTTTTTLVKQLKKNRVKNRVYVSLTMGYVSSSNKTLNFLKSNPNELKLVQKGLFCS